MDGCIGSWTYTQGHLLGKDNGDKRETKGITMLMPLYEITRPPIWCVSTANKRKDTAEIAGWFDFIGGA